MLSGLCRGIRAACVQQTRRAGLEASARLRDRGGPPGHELADAIIFQLLHVDHRLNFLDSLLLADQFTEPVLAAAPLYG